MNRRNFIQRFSAATAMAAAGLPLVATAAGPTHSSEPYRALNGIEVIVSGKAPRPLTMMFRSGAPQRVPLAAKPLAVSIEEHDAETAKMTFYAIEPDGSYRFMDYYFAGYNSRQNVGNYGVSLQLFPKLR